MKPLIATAILTAAYIYISAAVFGVPRGTVHRQAIDTAVPPRLFLNGEVAQVRATYQRVVVQSSRWDTRCKCYQYTVTPYGK